MRPDNLIVDTKDNMAELACDGQIACLVAGFPRAFLELSGGAALVLFTPRDRLAEFVSYLAGGLGKLIRNNKAPARWRGSQAAFIYR
ncbi:hypothetical protein MTP99_018467 [Tenebrio molitor]|jgi:hypothetical protein|nr:hypothetical protein MTP99_018467 [Tenebrio molitor]